MEWECMVPVERLSEDFQAVEDTIAKYGKAIIVSDNMPKYILMDFVANPSLKPLVDERELVKLLNGVGKRVFVQYYDYFRNDDDPLAFLADEDFSDNSKRSRTSKARAIFKNGWEKYALETIMKSNRTDAESVSAAKELYLQNFGRG